jgi:hypothetical protein
MEPFVIRSNLFGECAEPGDLSTQSRWEETGRLIRERTFEDLHRLNQERPKPIILIRVKPDFGRRFRAECGGADFTGLKLQGRKIYFPIFFTLRIVKKHSLPPQHGSQIIHELATLGRFPGRFRADHREFSRLIKVIPNRESHGVNLDLERKTPTGCIISRVTKLPLRNINHGAGGC